MKKPWLPGQNPGTRAADVERADRETLRKLQARVAALEARVAELLRRVAALEG